MAAGSVAPSPAPAGHRGLGGVITLDVLSRVRALMVANMCLMGVLVLFGSLRRRHRGSAVRLAICASYTLSYVAASSTVWLMQSSDSHNEMFPVWAIMLLLVYGSADAITANSLQENEESKSSAARLLVQSFWVGTVIAKYHGSSSFLWLLLSLMGVKMGERSLVYESASLSLGLQRSCKLVNDYMAYEHELSDEQEVDPTHMTGYNYLVTGEETATVRFRLPDYRMLLDIKDESITTVHQIWRCHGDLLKESAEGKPGGRLKDLCLSFALFKLLRRRFAGYPFEEGRRPKTWRFMFQGLLSEEAGGLHRAFRVIERELAFSYDLFYTKYPIFFDVAFNKYKSRVWYCLGIVPTCVLTAWAYAKSQSPKVEKVDLRVTSFVLLSIVVLEFWQLGVILFSDWSKVALLCAYVQRPSWRRNRIVGTAVGFICWVHRRSPWSRKLGQYSLLDSFNYRPCKLLSLFSLGFVDKTRKGQRGPGDIKLPKEVTEAVLVWLKNSGGRLTKGELSLQQNGVWEDLSWACGLDTETHVILVWHVATALCEIAASRGGRRGVVIGRHRMVATTLSKYCAYLVAFAPKLLPGQGYTTEYIFDKTVVETWHYLEGCRSPGSIYERVMAEGRPGESIIEKGAKLGKQLMEGVEDGERRWKVLADLWAELVLYVAPSDDGKVHAEYLATGGEFLTHLWALLSHAGIIHRTDLDLPPVETGLLATDAC